MLFRSGAAGIMMMIRLFIKKLPKWLVPAAAGLGMIGFQVYSEYTWFSHTRSLLPESAVVVAEVRKTRFTSLGRILNRKY